MENIQFAGGYVVLPLEKYEDMLKKCMQIEHCNVKEIPVVQLKQETGPEKKATEPEQKPLMRDPQKGAEKEMRHLRARSTEIDHGKINALHKAGWTPKQIAEECKISVATVYNHIDK